MANGFSVFALNCPFVSFDCQAKLPAGNYINLITQASAYTYIKIMKSKAKAFSAFLVGSQHG